MAVIIGTKRQIEEYFNSEALSQSKLKGLIGGLDFFLYKNSKSEKDLLYYEEKEHFIIGSAVDCILTGEEGQFEKDYHISNISKKPSDTILSIINQVFDSIKGNFENGYREEGIAFEDYIICDAGNEIESWVDLIEVSCDSHGYYPNWKMDTKVAKIIEFKEYFRDLCNSYGKQILSVEENEKVNSIVNSLRSNDRTAKYFDRSLYITEGVDIYYQLPIYFNHMGIDCKALLDIAIVIKEEHRVIPIDLKTMSGSTLTFLDSVKKLRYDIQAAFYTLALQSYFNTSVIASYMFIVESTTYIGKPLVYQLDKTLMNIAEYGKEACVAEGVIMRKSIKGITQLISDYKWYEENGWEEDRLTTGKEVLHINWDEIIE